MCYLCEKDKYNTTMYHVKYFQENVRTDVPSSGKRMWQTAFSIGSVQEPQSHEGWTLCTAYFALAIILHARKAI